MKGNKETAQSDFTKLDLSLRKLNSALAEHLTKLEKHAAAMEKLTQAMKQLDATFKKEIKLESHHSSPQLKEAISSFAEFYINPQYRNQDLLQIKTTPPPPKTAPQLNVTPQCDVAPQFNVTPNKDKVPSNVNRKKIEETIEQEMENMSQEMENINQETEGPLYFSSKEGNKGF